MADREKEVTKSFKSAFRPSRKRLKEIARKGSEQMANLDPKEIGDYSEEISRERSK